MSTEAARNLLIGDGSAPLKVMYFAIEGVAEQVRVALAVADVPFEDVLVQFKDWGTIKPTTKHGVMPEMTLPSGEILTESMAMLRLAGEADPEGKLYPSEMRARVKVEEVLGLVGDLSGAWRPSLMIGMRPADLGYDGKDEAVIQKLRAGFLADKLPKYMGLFADLIKESGDKFLTGEDLTIADISAYQAIGYFRKGAADHVPKDSLEPYPEVLAFLGRVEEHPKVAAYKASKAK